MIVHDLDRRDSSESSEQPVVVGVGSDPEPDLFVVRVDGQGSIGQENRDRVNRSRGVHLFEPESRVPGIVLESRERIARPLLHFRRK